MAASFGVTLNYISNPEYVRGGGGITASNCGSYGGKYGGGIENKQC